MFLVTLLIVFTGPCPPGLSAGTAYYCQGTPASTRATFATDQGKVRGTVIASTDWRGLAGNRHAGRANDDSSYASIANAVRGLPPLGIRCGIRYFALSQGGAHTDARTAFNRAGLRWVRGATLRGHTIPIGTPTGDGLPIIANQPGGWLAQRTAFMPTPASSRRLRYAGAMSRRHHLPRCLRLFAPS